MDEITQILRKCFNPNSLSLSSLHTQNLYVEGNCCRFRLMNHKISFTRTRARVESADSDIQPAQMSLNEPEDTC